MEVLSITRSIFQDKCKEFLIKKQNKDYPKADDIKENFFVGADGTIYEGRGFSREGEHTYGNKLICKSMIITNLLI